MNRNLVLALAAGLATSTYAAAQTAPAAAPAATATAPVAAPAPIALDAKIAIIAFEGVVVGTNEGQRTLADVQKKYEPKKNQIDALAAEVDSLKKQLQALPATTSDEDRASRLKTIDTKEKQLQFDAEAASTSYQSDLQEALAKVAQKVGGTAVKYAQDHGFTLLLNEGGQQQQSPLLWFAQETDISQAVVNAYNASSGVAAPPPSAPAPRRAAPKPAAAPAVKK